MRFKDELADLYFHLLGKISRSSHPLFLPGEDDMIILRRVDAQRF